MDQNQFYIDQLKSMFVDVAQRKRINSGVKPAPRAVFRKQHGIVVGKFKPLDISSKLGLSEEELGMFSYSASAKTEYDCILRFSSDTDPSSADIDSTIGIGLKIYGVIAENDVFVSPNSDLIFQNINRFFAKDAQEMYEFTKASLIDKNLDEFLKDPQHATLNEILDEMSHPESSCLQTTFYAILPFHLGTNKMAKYRLRPKEIKVAFPTEDKNYLAIDLHQRLLNDAYTFVLEAQVKDYDSSAGDNLQVVWDDVDFIPFAEVTLPKQDTNRKGLPEFGDFLNFNCWRVPSTNLPFGSIAETRRDVYKYGAETRYAANGKEMMEPLRTSCPYLNARNDNDADHVVVSAAIYPPIGVMRVGNSDEYYLGPLVPEPDSTKDEHFYRDATGKLKRQAAEFRIYGLNAKGRPIKELTIDDQADITWNCHLANQKAGWYQFQLALDIPEASQPQYINSFKRNLKIADRAALVIDGQKQSIAHRGEKRVFEGDFYLEKNKIYLGEMFLDETSGLGNSKRLHVVGGKGVAKSVYDEIAITFANNDGWYDDTSDGPVTASVVYQGVELTVQPAWVVCAPPDYAPMQKSVRTMWDLMRDLAVSNNMLPQPGQPSFTDDIYPIFKRMTDLQWVNAGFLTTFGEFGAYDFSKSEWIERLRDGSNDNREFRRQMYNQFRQFDLPGSQSPALWPWLYGDAVEIPADGSPRQHCTLTDLQLRFLMQWVKGEFIDDWDKKSMNLEHPKPIDAYPVELQPDILTKAALDFCLADAFHPGCEMTWPVRQATMYQSAFRFMHDTTTSVVDSLEYGPFLTPQILNADSNPFQGQVAGSITRWMAIPWQTDTSSCRDGYDTSYDTYLPTFWPARVPNNILGLEQYLKIISHPNNPDVIREFNYRKEWLEDLPGHPTRYTDYREVINNMITNFDSVGVVLPKSINVNNLPQTVQVAIPKIPVFLANHKVEKQEEKLLAMAGAKPKLMGLSMDSPLVEEQVQEIERLSKIAFVKPGERVITIQEKFRERFR